MAIIITHNFDGKKFKRLYAKYAYGCNPEKHCTNAIKGRYSKMFSRLNDDFMSGQTIVMDEFPLISWDAIYICGVSSKGYSKHENYPHNVHVAIIPKAGVYDHWEFENWVMDVQNGVFEYVISEDELEDKYRSFPEQYRTCRMLRWAVTHYKEDLSSITMTRGEMLEKLHTTKFEFLDPESEWDDVGFTERPIWVNSKGYGYVACDEHIETWAGPGLSEKQWAVIKSKLINESLLMEDIKETPLFDMLDTILCVDGDDEDLRADMQGLLLLPSMPSKNDHLYVVQECDSGLPQFFVSEKEFLKEYERDWCDYSWDELDNDILARWIKRLC